VGTPRRGYPPVLPGGYRSCGLFHFGQALSGALEGIHPQALALLQLGEALAVAEQLPAERAGADCAASAVCVSARDELFDVRHSPTMSFSTRQVKYN